MKEITYSSSIKVYDSVADLLPESQKAMVLAIDMLSKAYAPYSNFYVGAAAVTSSGNLYPGCNQENASYPLCICGERVALYNAGSYEPNSAITTLAIVCKSAEKEIPKPVSPCGACRQVISEFEQRHGNSIQILLKGDGNLIYGLDSGAELLPFFFDKTYL